MDIHREETKKYRENSEWDKAGDYYSSVAYKRRSELAPGAVSHAGIQYFMRAVLCYRIGGNKNRCRNRSKMAILHAEDMKDRVANGEKPEDGLSLALYGKWYECIGDFRTVGDLEGAEEAYQKSEQIYREAGHLPIEHNTGEHPDPETYFYDIAYGAGYDMDRYKEHYDRETFVGWLEFKRDHLHEFVDEIINKGEWRIPGDEE